MGDISLRGPIPPLTSTTTATVIAPSKEPPVSQVAPTPEVQQPPSDVASTSEIRQVTGRVHQDIGSLKPTSAQALATFFTTNATKAATAALRTGDTWSIRIGDDTITVSHTELTEALKTGRLDGESAPARSLMVAELTASIGLPGPAQRAVLKSFALAIDKGVPPFKAMKEAQFNAILAADVERYFGDKEGLAKDMRHIGQFTDTAKVGGFSFLNSLKDRDKSKQIKENQTKLNAALHGFTKALGEAQENGDYVGAFDALQKFFVSGSKITHDPYWSKRLEERAPAMQVSQLQNARHKAQSAVGESLLTAASTGASAKLKSGSTVLKSLDMPFAEREQHVQGLHPQERTPLVQQLSIGGQTVEAHRKMWSGKDGSYDEFNPAFTQYLNEAQSQKHVVSGQLVDNDGTGRKNAVLRSAAFRVATDNPTGIIGKEETIFVLGADSRLYAANQSKESDMATTVDGSRAPLHFHHASFKSGQDVGGAGEIHTNADGFVTKVTNQSGHYKPTADQTDQVLDQLDTMGVNLDNVAYTHFNKDGQVSGMAAEYQRGGRTGAEREVRFHQRHEVTREVTGFAEYVAKKHLVETIITQLPVNFSTLPPAERRKVVLGAIDARTHTELDPQTALPRAFSSSERLLLSQLVLTELTESGDVATRQAEFRKRQQEIEDSYNEGGFRAEESAEAEAETEEPTLLPVMDPMNDEDESGELEATGDTRTLDSGGMQPVSTLKTAQNRPPVEDFYTDESDPLAGKVEDFYLVEDTSTPTLRPPVDLESEGPPEESQEPVSDFYTLEDRIAMIEADESVEREVEEPTHDG